MTGSTSRGNVEHDRSALRRSHAQATLKGAAVDTDTRTAVRGARDTDVDVVSGLLAWARESWHILAVLTAFVISMFVVPVMTNVPVGDDWVYTRSVEILLQDGRIEILDLSVVTLLFQVFWGALFSLLFGTSFGSMRLSTTVLFLASGPAVYGLCLELGVRKARAALGTALYLFNPLAYVLAFSFMTDPQFTSLMVIASYFYVRGLRIEDPSTRHVVIGSAFAACAFLVRQQGLLIPLAVGLYLLLARRWWFDRAGVITAIRVAGIPAVATVLYYAWLLLIHGTPEQQGAFVDQIRTTGFESTRLLLYRMTYIEIAYAGLFVLPIMLATIWYFVSGIRDRVERRLQVLHLVVLFMLMIAGGMIAFGSADRLMPFISQYLGLHGLGPQDLIGGRDQLLGMTARRIVNWAIYLSSALFILLLYRRFRGGYSPDRATASLVVSLAFWQVVGIMPPSFHFAGWIISVDRYLLPLLPFAIGLALWAIRDIRLSMPVAWVLTAVFAFYSIAGTRDFLVFQEATWDMGRTAIAMGVPYDKLDAGAGWDGYYLHELQLPIDDDTRAAIGSPWGPDEPVATRSPGGSPWWTDLFAKATDSSYIVASSIPSGWPEESVIAKQEYSSWLHDEPQYLYLLRRPGVAGPP
jgi:hypothetical protein